MFIKPLIKNRNGKYGNNLWVVKSPKLNRVVRLFSNIEYYNWLLIEADPNIKTFCEQPKKVEGFINGKWKESILDMWYQTTEGKEVFIEVKHEHEIDPNHPKFSQRSYDQVLFQEEWCIDNGYEYILRTDNYLKELKLYINNLKILVPYMNDPAIETDIHKVLSNINSLEKTTISEIQTTCAEIPPYRLRKAIYKLIYDGKIQCNIRDFPLGLKTEVWKIG